jgi:hypothetical protein
MDIGIALSGTALVTCAATWFCWLTTIERDGVSNLVFRRIGKGLVLDQSL